MVPRVWNSLNIHCKNMEQLENDGKIVQLHVLKHLQELHQISNIYWQQDGTDCKC